ncbi:MAG: DUF1667 domain-containing protein [Spirochaetales bacterium]|nr:DUF1667 domain-containing protein [Spirochaetales bacterium]
MGYDNDYDSKKKEVLCIRCPKGCLMRVIMQKSGIEVIGAKCENGITYAESEIICPMRLLTTTVQTVFSGQPRLPVKTSGEIPLSRFPEVLRKIREILVRTALQPGDIAAKDIAGSGIHLICTGGIDNDQDTAFY